MQALHKILTGEISFRNNHPVKVCNVEHNFGANWKADLDAYAKKLPADQKAILDRQVARLQLTRYTTRELAEYCGEGAAHLDAVAQKANVEQGKAFLAKHGAEKFAAHVQAEGKHANWSDAQVKKFIDAVKAAK
ncbi:hypothetical protein STCU_04357 [Strigomonas culicis]|nr:hypothetical protein STCU_04357 [Strigomonas culicis]|eukprot:EPY29664.1 hypothetical protein STCU_04357 [Strigomonas culicis]